VTVIKAVDHKCIELLRDEFDRHYLAFVSIAEGAFDADNGVFEAVVEVPDVEDWNLRHEVLRSAISVEDSLGVRVQVFFRSTAPRLTVAGL
jgi:hypothetical protein